MRLALLALVVACAEEPKKVVEAPPPPPPVEQKVVEAPKPPVRLWSDDEAQQLADSALARIAENAKLTCAAPPIGKPVQGSSTDEVLALMTARTPCLEQVAALDVTALRDKKPEALAVDKQCGDEIAKAVAHAAAFTSGCSPYLTGVRVEPDRMTPIFNLAWELTIHARTAKDAPTLLAGIRVMEDLARGRTSLIVAMISDAGIGIIAKRLDELVETAKFTRAEAAATTKALSALVEGSPSFAEILAGEHQVQELMIGVPLIQAADWTPPGGKRVGWPKLVTDATAHPHDVCAGTLLAIAKAAAADASACPSGSNIDACRQGLLDAAGKRTAPHASDVWKHGVRDQVIDVLAFQLFAADKYAEKQQNAYGMLSTIGSKLGLKGL